jgi:hypothetical protein
VRLQFSAPCNQSIKTASRYGGPSRPRMGGAWPPDLAGTEPRPAPVDGSSPTGVLRVRRRTRRAGLAPVGIRRAGLPTRGIGHPRGLRRLALGLASRGASRRASSRRRIRRACGTSERCHGELRSSCTFRWKGLYEAPGRMLAILPFTRSCARTHLRPHRGCPQDVLSMACRRRRRGHYATQEKGKNGARLLP